MIGKRTKYRFKHYELTYDLYFENGYFKAEADGWDQEETVFSAKKEKDAKKKMENWFEDIIKQEKFWEFHEKGYYMDISFGEFLEDVRKTGALYHTSLKNNREGILKEGLIAGKTADSDVDLASFEMDKIKPSWVPEHVKRSSAVYFHPAMDSYYLLFCERENVDLYATRIKDENAWVGSQGYGGFCLFDSEYENNKELLENHRETVKNEWGPTYWKYSCSLADYIKNGSSVRKKDREAGLDEVLIFKNVPKEEVVLIGSWDENSIFRPNEHFKDFVKKGKEKRYELFLYELKQKERFN